MSKTLRTETGFSRFFYQNGNIKVPINNEIKLFQNIEITQVGLYRR